VPWWAVYSAPHCELTARDALLALGLGVFCPHERVKRLVEVTPPATYHQRVFGVKPRSHTVVMDRLEPLWPRYLFACAPWLRLSEVFAAKGVQDLVRGAEQQPLKVPEPVVEALVAVADKDGLTNSKDLSRLSNVLRIRPGDKLQLKPENPFAGLLVWVSSVARLDDSGVIDAWVKMFGRLTPLAIDYRDVERVIGASKALAPVA